MNKQKSIAPMIGALLAPNAPKRPSDRQMTREHARSAKQRATEDWVSGRITTDEHNAVHSRADHVLSGKAVRAFRGKSGERKMRGL